MVRQLVPASLAPMKPRPPMTTIRMRSLVERSMHHEIDGRSRAIPGNKALAEIPHEIVVGCLGVRPCNTAEAMRHLRFHSKPRKFVDDCLQLVRWNNVML